MTKKKTYKQKIETKTLVNATKIPKNSLLYYHKNKCAMIMKCLEHIAEVLSIRSGRP